jgi:hypothetical protein
MFVGVGDEMDDGADAEARAAFWFCLDFFDFFASATQISVL